MTSAPSSSSAKKSSPPTALSPHLQIWKFTVTMAASITHRACGGALYGGTLILAIWLFATAKHPPLYGIISDLLASPLGLIFLAFYSWALMFHMFNGVRHLFWDAGHGFDLPTARRTAMGAYIFATIMMIIIMVLGLKSAGIL